VLVGIFGFRAKFWLQLGVKDEVRKSNITLSLWTPVISPLQSRRCLLE